MPAGNGNVQIHATLQELDKLAGQTPELAEVAVFYRAVLPMMSQYRQKITPFHMEPQVARSKLEAGIPLLVGEELPFSGDNRGVAALPVRDLFLNLCKMLEGSRDPARSMPGNGTKRSGRSLDFFSLWKRAQDGDGDSLRAAAARQIRQAVERGDLNLTEVWEMLTAGEWRRLELTAVGLNLDAQLLRVLAQSSLKPVFQVWAQGLQEAVVHDRTGFAEPASVFDRWQRGYCPVCGSSPSLSEVQGKEAARRLRCSLCGAGWRYPHLKCAFCENDDYKLLSYFSVEGEEDRYKLQACNVCQGYIKSIKTFEPIPVDQLIVQDLATLHLDLIAADHGYTRMTAG